MRNSLKLAPASILVAAMLFLDGCPPSFPDRCSGGECIGCDLSREPRDQPACVVDLVGVFVSPNGDDGAEGTKRSPVKTIGKAIEKAEGRRLRIYICEADYEEAVVLKSAISLIGGFTCNDWQPGGPAKVHPKERGPALRIEGVPSPVVLADLTFTALPAADPGESSVGGIISATSGVTLRRVTVAAGDGAPGKAPDPGPGRFPPAPSGNNADGGVPGPAIVNNCPDGTVSQGGAGGPTGERGSAGTPAIPPSPTANDDGAGGIPAAGAGCSASGTGHRGASGRGGDGGAGASTIGGATASGWGGTNGAAGGSGQTAQGGGGGGGLEGPSGGGGSGGCGGQGGAAGQCGGSSIALLALESRVTLEACVLLAGNAGNAGDGGNGQVGQTAGNTGAGQGCNGGPGGYGGHGGGGGGGAGGSSIALGYRGLIPVLDGAEVDRADARPGWSTAAAGKAGSPGQAGRGPNGEGGSGAAGTAGISGVAAAVLPVP
ncbi:hypothetical protein LVJ94_24970 [Pendulispora rubella]|uniref:PE-PGRS family protein n=1 Tax=Pendulispora rubella TaxID=2741070 RepID=A0ABZ2LIS7_9BACT